MRPLPPPSQPPPSAPPPVEQELTLIPLATQPLATEADAETAAAALAVAADQLNATNQSAALACVVNSSFDFALAAGPVPRDAVVSESVEAVLRNASDANETELAVEVVRVTVAANGSSAAQLVTVQLSVTARRGLQLAGAGAVGRRLQVALGLLEQLQIIMADRAHFAQQLPAEMQRVSLTVGVTLEVGAVFDLALPTVGELCADRRSNTRDSLAASPRRFAEGLKLFPPALASQTSSTRWSST